MFVGEQVVYGICILLYQCLVGWVIEFIGPDVPVHTKLRIKVQVLSMLELPCLIQSSPIRKFALITYKNLQRQY